MAEQQLTFTRSLHFPGLDPSPNTPQAATLLWEIDNDATLSAASISVRFGQIDIVALEEDNNGAPADLVVTFELEQSSAGISWSEINGTQQSALLAVLAAHTGTPTRNDEQSVVDASTTLTTGTGWVNKLEIVSAPLQAGIYRFTSYCDHRLDATPVIFGTDRSQARLTIDTGGGDSARGNDDNITMHAHSTVMTSTYTAREGESITIRLQHQGNAAGITSNIRRARLALVPVLGTES